MADFGRKVGTKTGTSPTVSMGTLGAKNPATI
jgi:hypothetical protein